MAIQLEQISNVTTIVTMGVTIYNVTLIDNTVCTVPNDPDNADYPAVQEWLALHP